MTEIGTRLKAARKERGWTLREAERRTGIPNAHISQIETGAISRPELATVAPIAAAYGLSLDELAGEAKAPRCPDCCVHGIPLTRNCGWCEPGDDDPERAEGGCVSDGQPMWLCRHGIGTLARSRSGVSCRSAYTAPAIAASSDVDRPQFRGEL